MAKSRYHPPSKAEAIKHHLAKHSAAYEKHFRQAAKAAPPPPDDKQAMLQAMEAAHQATAQEMAPEAPAAPAGAPGSGVPAPA